MQGAGCDCAPIRALLPDFYHLGQEVSVQILKWDSAQRDDIPQVRAGLGEHMGAALCLMAASRNRVLRHLGAFWEPSGQMTMTASLVPGSTRPLETLTV